jgi:hypothetical protein
MADKVEMPCFGSLFKGIFGDLYYYFELMYSETLFVKAEIM